MCQLAENRANRQPVRIGHERCLSEVYRHPTRPRSAEGHSEMNRTCREWNLIWILDCLFASLSEVSESITTRYSLPSKKGRPEDL